MSSHWYLGDHDLLCNFLKKMQVIRAFSLHKRCYKLYISFSKSLNTFTFWSLHLNLLRICITSLWTFHLHEVSCIENLGFFCICIFSRQFISVKIYSSNVAALEYYDSEILVLKRLKWNAVNNLAWFICVKVLSPQPEVFF